MSSARAGFGVVLLLVCGVAAIGALEVAPAADPESTVEEQREGEESPSAVSDPPASFPDTITVTATRGPRAVEEVAGTVTVIDADEIERGSMSSSADLVRHLPNVSVATSPTRTGPSGFVIRGIGGNRVLTQIDGVSGLEEFEFGIFEIPQPGVGLDAVQSVEILRGGNSSLYGSDALGGVVSFLTKDPGDYLVGEPFHLGLRLGWDGRDRGRALGASTAGGGQRWQGALTVARRDGRELDNQGTVGSFDKSRTEPNPQQWESSQLLGKVVYHVSAGHDLELAVEGYQRSAETELLSSQGAIDFGMIFGFPPDVTFLLDKAVVDGRDEQRRVRVSVEESLQALGPLDRMFWRAWHQAGRTEQTTREKMTTSFGGGFFGPVIATDLVRSGVLTLEQDSVGVEAQVQQALAAWGGHHLLTFGLTMGIDRFDQWRDSEDLQAATGEPQERSDGLIFPTKYFPRSDVRQLGAYAQAELDLAGGRLKVIPGLRFDDYELDADQADQIYLSGNLGTQPAVDLEESATSPKLGAIARLGRHLSLRGQYAEGFRAPPYSAVNGGFTHLAGGLTRLPNPDLRPETSAGWEVGLRGRFDRGFFDLVWFDNRYEDFIELVPLGLDRVTGLIEFQQQNVNRARIRGAELSAELVLGSRWSLWGAAGWAEGVDREADAPLPSVEPASVSTGVERTGDNGRWGGQLVVTFAAAKSESDVPADFDQFRTPSYQLVDITAFYRVSNQLSLQLGIFNLLDETYWEWSAVRGLGSTSPVIDRYSAPGLSASAGIRYRW